MSTLPGSSNGAALALAFSHIGLFVTDIDRMASFRRMTDDQRG